MPWFWSKKKKVRVSGELVVAMMFFNTLGEVLLVGRKGKLTIPTGHLDFGEDMIDAFVREMSEEFIGESGENNKSKMRIEISNLRDKITNSYGTVLRESGSGENKLIEIIPCRLSLEEARLLAYVEEAEGQLWVRPGQIKNLSLLDPLAREAIARHQKRYPPKKRTEEGGKDGRSVKAEQNLVPIS